MVFGSPFIHFPIKHDDDEKRIYNNCSCCVAALSYKVVEDMLSEANRNIRWGGCSLVARDWWISVRKLHFTFFFRLSTDMRDSFWYVNEGLPLKTLINCFHLNFKIDSQRDFRFSVHHTCPSMFYTYLRIFIQSLDLSQERII